ncbi:MAG: Crp/Fnr family transcriptional regulator [Ruminococcaceae bacterium]|mgnify:CR=1 FL=1|nr:Crp/Fnr family transcriptional regulator [Oscillospiraceae bacterium]
MKNELAVSSFFPFWEKMEQRHRDLIENRTNRLELSPGRIIGGDDKSCLGLLLVISGRLKAFILSNQGREVSLYRLFERDICLFTASCTMNNMNFEIQFEVEKKTSVYQIPPDVVEEIQSESVEMAQYVVNLMTSRFSEVMWTIEQILFKSLDARLAAALIEQQAIDESDELIITHDMLAKQMGSAREVVTRTLNYLKSEGLVEIGRGKIKILDYNALYDIANRD